jgi:hypothetical protein
MNALTARIQHASECESLCRQYRRTARLAEFAKRTGFPVKTIARIAKGVGWPLRKRERDIIRTRLY